MKKVLTLIGTWYVLISLFLATDLNPLLLWSWYRENINSLIEFMFNIHPGLPFTWLMSVLLIGVFLGAMFEAEEQTN